MEIKINRDEIKEAVKVYLSRKFALSIHTDEITFSDDYGRLTSATYEPILRNEPDEDPQCEEVGNGN